MQIILTCPVLSRRIFFNVKKNVQVREGVDRDGIITLLQLQITEIRKEQLKINIFDHFIILVLLFYGELCANRVCFL